MPATLAPAPAVLNQEAPLRALAGTITPTAEFYQRTNFDVPHIDPDAWSLGVSGRVRHPLRLSLSALRALPARSLAVTLECAGNGRSLVTPLPPGQPWGLGAVSTAVFTGVPLRGVLDRAGVAERALEVVFAGADGGSIGGGRTARFERSLPLEQALDPDVLLAWEMNGEPLPPRHGFPLRLVVPGWYGIASVKWLTDIRVVADPFEGHFQTERYIYLGDAGAADGTPVARVRVRAVIAEPAQGTALAAGVPVVVRGTAWSGEAPVRRVELSADGGSTWRDAHLGTPASPHAATPWETTWTPPRAGRFVLVARATDRAGNVQPLEPVWNELGYGNNAVHRVEVQVG